ncbi:hypothetical protein Q9L58_000401 [Maublancomyces gigas]|uniref:Cyanovirin-N domain-containing protein n=1 Tax=Discina gigas TaxID=1032678 RepID=A0ABR3GWZ6_9PEZI
MSYRFHVTSHYISVNDQCLLSAVCARRDGRTWSPTTIELNTVLGNDDGAFSWDSNGFGAEAKEIRLIDRHILSARLKRNDGSWTEKPVTVDLAERIENLDGTLHCH